MSLATRDSKADKSNASQTPAEDVQSKSESPVKTEKLATSNGGKIASPSSRFGPAVQGLTKAEESAIKQVNNRQEFDKFIETIKDKYILVWFSAAWCGPCSTMAIKFHELARKYRHKIEILKVDVDDLEDLALENEVSRMPAYIIIRNGQKLAHYFGSKQEQIDDLAEKYLE